MGLQRESMGDRIKKVLIERILDGTYQSGDRLVELAIAKEMNTSQAPVREAFRELEAMRLVECEPYRGTRVRQVSTRELQESYQVRGVLEEMAAQLASPNFQKHPEPLQAALTAIHVAAESENLQQLAHDNGAFHRLIVETSGNSVLLRVWDSLDIEVWTRINLTHISQTTFNLKELIEEHQLIVDALVKGDGQTAGLLLRQHLNNALTLIH
jgi:DNA-binding GntR family transcriptional regulator